MCCWSSSVSSWWNSNRYHKQPIPRAMVWHYQFSKPVLVCNFPIIVRLYFLPCNKEIRPNHLKTTYLLSNTTVSVPFYNSYKQTKLTTNFNKDGTWWIQLGIHVEKNIYQSKQCYYHQHLLTIKHIKWNNFELCDLFLP